MPARLRWGIAIAIVSLLSIGLLTAQAEAPALDPVLVMSWQRRATLAQAVVTARDEALRATPEGKAYLAALEAQRAEHAAIQKDVQVKAPGYTLDLATGKLSKQKGS